MLLSSVFLILCFGLLDAARNYQPPPMPCCLESLGIKTCTRLKARDPERFSKRCKYEADFAILQCCHTCKTDISNFGARVFSPGYKSTQCFDRARCHKDVCNSSVIAFRVCRKTCGFCDVNVYNNATIPTHCPLIG